MTDIIDDIANCKGMGSVKWEDYDSNSKNLIIEALCKKVKELESKFNSETKASYEELEIAYSKVDKLERRLSELQLNERLKELESLLEVFKKDQKGKYKILKLIGRFDIRLNEMEAKLSESGVKWDFRLDELNGFIEEQNKKLSDNTIVKRFMETEDHFKMTLWMMFETVLRNEKELQSLTLPFGEEGLTNVESHKHLWNKINTIDNNISGKVKGLEAVVSKLITELERRGAGSICEFYKGLLAQLTPPEREAKSCDNCRLNKGLCRPTAGKAYCWAWEPKQEPTLKEATKQLLETIRFKPKEPKPTPLSTTEMNMRATAGFTEPYKTPDSLLKIKEQDPLRECVKHLDGTIEHRELKEKEPPSEPSDVSITSLEGIELSKVKSFDAVWVKRSKVIEKLQSLKRIFYDDNELNDELDKLIDSLQQKQKEADGK